MLMLFFLLLITGGGWLITFMANAELKRQNNIMRMKLRDASKAEKAIKAGAIKTYCKLIGAPVQEYSKNKVLNDETTEQKN